MKLLYDFFPIALFFLAYQLAGIYAATVVAILASIAQVSHSWLKTRNVETMHVVSLVLIVSLGSLTLILQDKAFIMWKPTLVNWMFACVFLATSLIGSKPLIHRVLGSQLELPTHVWKRLNLLWVGFFILSGAANVYFVKSFQMAETALISAAPELDASTISDLNCVADFNDIERQLCQAAKDSEDNWVNFKLFGMMGLTFLFVIIQGFYLYRFMDPDEETDNPIN